VRPLWPTSAGSIHWQGQAALAAMQDHNERRSDKRQQIENAIQQARYEAARARRQYDASITIIAWLPAS